MENKTILYDAHCNFCIASVDFFVSNTKDDRLTILPLQAKEARALLRTYNIQFIDLQTIYFIDGKLVLKKSRAVFRICKYLNFPFNVLFLLSVLPKGLTDNLYDHVARCRYKLLSKKTKEVTG